MSILDIINSYDNSPEDDNEELGIEKSIILQMENQFEQISPNYIREDLIKRYCVDSLKIDIDSIDDLDTFETYITNQIQEESFLFLMDSVKFYLEKYYGIDTRELEPDVADFNLIYILYTVFVLNLNQTMAHFMNGMKSPLNLTIQDHEKYTLLGCYKDRIKEFKFSEENLKNMSMEAIIQTNIQEKDNTPMNIESIDMYINSAQAFNDLFKKIFMDDSVFDFDKLFETIRCSDESMEMILLDNLTDNGALPIDVIRLKDRIKRELVENENLDDLENRYRNLIKIVETKEI